jgi:dihydroorotate dehydrogenase (fumarate)
MGLRLKSPVVVAASTLSWHLLGVRQAEVAGAGALVLRSLFEEQITRHPQELRMLMEEASRIRSPLAAPPIQTVPPGPEAYIEWAKRVRETVSMPVIASVNAGSPGHWSDFVRSLEDAGVDAIELNIYRIPNDPTASAAVLEDETVEIVRRVCGKIRIPVAVKLSPFYTSPGHLAQRLTDAGAKALVLFNRFLQPDIDTDSEEIVSELEFSSPSEIKMPLRWIALLYGRIPVDMALNTGVHSARGVVKALLAGATVVQVASVLYRHGINHLRDLHSGLMSWMAAKGYSSLDEFRGKLSQACHPEAAELERAHYVKLLLSQN